MTTGTAIEDINGAIKLDGTWDGRTVILDGQLDLDTRDCTITYRQGGKKLAVAVAHRDLEGLRAEVGIERAIAATA